MKKILVILILLASLISCKMQFYDDEGFTIFGLGAVLEKNEILFQSHDGFIIDDTFYNEVKLYGDKIKVINKLGHDIDLKITTENESLYIELPKKSVKVFIYNNNEWIL